MVPPSVTSWIGLLESISRQDRLYVITSGHCMVTVFLTGSHQPGQVAQSDTPGTQDAVLLLQPCWPSVQLFHVYSLPPAQSGVSGRQRHHVSDSQATRRGALTTSRRILSNLGSITLCQFQFQLQTNYKYQIQFQLYLINTNSSSISK